MRKHHRRFDASVETSGPHDFTLRGIVTRQLTTSVHRIPRPTFVTIAIRPSYRAGTGRASKGDLPDGTSGILGGAHKPLRPLKRTSDRIWSMSGLCLRRHLAPSNSGGR